MMHGFGKKGTQLGENKKKYVKLRISTDKTNSQIIIISAYHWNLSENPSLIVQGICQVFTILDLIRWNCKFKNIL